MLINNLMSKFKTLIEKIKPFADKGNPVLTAGIPFLPVLATGLILLGCANAPALQKIPERLSVSDILVSEADTYPDGETGVEAGTGTISGMPGQVSSAGTTASAAGTGSVAAGTGNAAAAVQKPYTKPANGYKDGSYTGTSQGFGGPVSVRVVISSGKITNISILSAAKEDAQFLEKAKGVIGKILSAQTPNVDAVSGATYSSNGIINAVKNALSKAGAVPQNQNTASSETKDNAGSSPSGNNVPPTDNTEPAPSDNSGQQDRTEPLPADQPDVPDSQENQPVSDDQTLQSGNGKDPAVKFADGRYSASSFGFGGQVVVDTVIENNIIKSISVISADGETPAFLQDAVKVIDDILANQNTDVDTVSGATYSSRAIIDSVKKALQEAEQAAGTAPGQQENSIDG